MTHSKVDIENVTTDCQPVSDGGLLAGWHLSLRFQDSLQIPDILRVERAAVGEVLIQGAGVQFSVIVGTKAGIVVTVELSSHGRVCPVDPVTGSPVSGTASGASICFQYSISASVCSRTSTGAAGLVPGPRQRGTSGAGGGVLSVTDSPSCEVVTPQASTSLHGLRIVDAVVSSGPREP